MLLQNRRNIPGTNFKTCGCSLSRLTALPSLLIKSDLRVNLHRIIVLTSMTMQAALLETAAGEMAEAMKTQWFEALLRQDMAYYDINDVNGTAVILNVNGKKFRKYVTKK